MNEITRVDAGRFAMTTVEELRQRITVVHRVMETLMKKDTHYGVIPGCKEPSLYKPGAELILATFGISVEPAVEDLSAEDVIRYRVKAIGTTGAGTIVGCGIGECSSDEDKYRWRGAVSDAEYNATLETRRREKYYKNGGHSKQVRTNPADVANTILKMAKKRAMVDLCLTSTACSDIFTQDIEDMEPATREAITKREEQRAKPKQDVAPANEGEEIGIIESVEDGAKLKSGQQLYYVLVDGQKYGTTNEAVKASASDYCASGEPVRLVWVLHKGFKYVKALSSEASE